MDTLSVDIAPASHDERPVAPDDPALLRPKPLDLAYE
jgi:hypothetical protein